MIKGSEGHCEIKKEDTGTIVYEMPTKNVSSLNELVDMISWEIKEYLQGINTFARTVFLSRGHIYVHARS